jgi:hypothetical protein
MGSRWYTPDFYSHHCHCSISLTVAYPGVEVKCFKCLYEGGYSLLHVGICCKPLASQVQVKKDEKLWHLNEKPVSVTTSGLRITLPVVQISNLVISTYVDYLTGSWLSDVNTDLPNAGIKTLISEWDKCSNLNGDKCWLFRSMVTTLAVASQRELSPLNNVLQ